MAKSKIVYGDKDVLPAGKFDPKKSKIKISLLLDGDVLDAYKEAAKKTTHGEYQTLMKEKLREAIFGKQIDLDLQTFVIEYVDQKIHEAELKLKDEIKKVS